MRPLTGLGLAHAAIAVAGAALMFALVNGSAATAIDEPTERLVFVRLLVAATLAASAAAVAVGLLFGRQRAMLAADLATLAAAAGVVAVRLLVGSVSRDGLGLLLVGFVVARFAPVLVHLVADGRGGARLVFAVSAAAYAAFGVWGVIGMLAQGDQPHYMLAAEAMRRGSLDSRPLYDGPLYSRLSGEEASIEAITQVIETPAGSRFAGGYGLSLVILPGWALAGRVGAVLTMCVVGALASAAAFLLARDILGDRWEARLGWLVTTWTVPFLSYTTTVYPNIVGALLILAGTRWLTTSRVPRPALAAVACGLTLFLTPRDGLSVLLLLPFALLLDRRSLRRYAVGLVAMLLLSTAVNAVVYGSPLPYAGYLVGRSSLELRPPPFALRPDVALPGLLFDRAFGLAGSAPWAFLAALGAVPLVRARPRLAVPALVVFGGTLVSLSFYGLWYGGWAPPNRYAMDVLPLLCPFVAAGLCVARTFVLRAVTAALLLPSIVATVVLVGIPTMAYSDLAESRLMLWAGQFLPVNPFALLPAFYVDDGLTAYLRSLVAAGLVALLVLIGWRARLPALTLAGGVPGHVAAPAPPARVDVGPRDVGPRTTT